MHLSHRLLLPPLVVDLVLLRLRDELLPLVLLLLRRVDERELARQLRLVVDLTRVRQPAVPVHRLDDADVAPVRAPSDAVYAITINFDKCPGGGGGGASGKK